MEQKERIEMYALENAILHEGRAEIQAVLNHLFKDGLEKDKIKDVMPEIQEAIKKVNKLGIKEQHEEIKKYSQEISKIEEEKKARERTGLPELENVKIGKIVTRLAPEPSKYNHIGHALSFLLNYLYAKKYKGKCLLRFEDTNPEKVSQEYIDAMKEDVLDYLNIKVKSIRYVSDDMKKFYAYAEKIIKLGKAYMCFCEQEKLKKLREDGIECSCRQQDAKKNLAEWKKFLKNEYKKNQATLRIKGNMQSNNYVMRDSILFRAIDVEHYRHKKKYKVWPMFDFYNPIEDHLMKITHILRSNEFDVRVELQEHIKELLDLRKQTIVHYGRFNVIGMITQGRDIRERIEKKEMLGWDDPRLATLRAMKRRGILKETFYQLTEQAGLSKHPVNLSFDMISSINRKLLDPIAERYYFVYSPVKLKIKNKPDIKEIEVKIHPEKQERRKLSIGEIFISQEDYEKNISKEVRLMHLFNIKLKKNNEADFTSLENKDISKIQFVSNFVKARVLMPDGNWIDGIADEGIKNLKIGSIIQFERFGFVRLDRINEAGEYEFWFSHR